MWMVFVLGAAAQEAPPSAVVVEGEPTGDTVSMRLSIVPGIGWNASPSDRVEGVSMGFFSHATSLEGLDAELGLSWVDGEMDGLQASVGANVAGTVDGLQLTSGANWARGDVNMGQLAAGANVAEGDVVGMQGAGFLNVAGGSIEGVQASGFLNVAAGEESSGIQASGGLNVARGIEGLQGAPVNVARTVKGAQIGLLNIAEDSDGLQLGLVNVAKTSKVSIAPINLVADGLHRVDVWASESSLANIGVKFGSKHVYTLIGAGWVNSQQPWWTFGGGLGLHIPIDRLWLEVDDSVWGLAAGNVLAPGLHNKLRGQVGFDLAPHFAPFVGVSVNTWAGTGEIWPRAVDLPSRVSNDRRLVSWPGLHAGLSF